MVRKFADEAELRNEGRGNRGFTVPLIYEKIKRSNSSLNRKSKKLLEDSIERVLLAMKQDQEEDSDFGSMEGDYDGVHANGFEVNVADNNIMNKTIVGMWTKTPQSNNVNETKETSPVKSKKRTVNGEPPSKKRKIATQIDRSPPTNVSLDDLGGVDEVIQQLHKLLFRPLLKPQVYTRSGIKPPRGILLHGPPGCGKTMIANAFAAEYGVPFIPLSAPSIVSGMSGESEKALRDHFEEAKRMAPCLVFIDEIDAITPKRENAQREMEKRIVAQLLTCMDELALKKTGGKAVIILAATNRPDSLDPALRRAGRFDREINMSVPAEPVREQILRALTREMSIDGDVNFKQLARLTPGYVGADLDDLVSTAGATALERLQQALEAESDGMYLNSRPSSRPVVIEVRHDVARAKETGTTSHETVSITNEDFLAAVPKIQPSSKREGFATIPDTTWADIGALQSVREELIATIVDPIRYPERYARFPTTAPAGVLLWGPPGCGKTLLAKAVANESGANFISVKGPELLNKYVGESERAVRQTFARARSSIPCVIFFDEMESLVPKRRDSLSESSSRTVNTMLTELDGLNSREGIYVIGATNRPDTIDPAMLRPGRLETLLFVDLPIKEERVEILRTLVRKWGVDFDEHMAGIARACEGYSGADLGMLVRKAERFAVKRNDWLRSIDLEKATTLVKCSVVEDRRKYDMLKARWGTGAYNEDVG